jgi:hypothetical protein
MNVERVISEVSREIATAEPRADFSARVLDRIDAADRRWRRIRLIGATTGLVAAAALAVFVVRGSWTPPTLPAVPERAAARVAAPAPARVGSGLEVTYVTSRPDPRKRSAPATPVTPTVEEEWLARAVPALEATTPITIEKPRTGESIQPASLQIPLMGVDVIGTDPLSIPPIGGKHE